MAEVWTGSLIASGERELSRVLLHQVFESAQPDNLPERHMDGFGPGLRPESFLRLVGKTGVHAD